MNILRCAAGHYYDADQFRYCPHCLKLDQVQSLSIPDAFTDLGDVLPLKKGSTSVIYEVMGPTHMALKVISCENTEELRLALHEIAVMRRLAGKKHAVQFKDARVEKNANGTAVYILESFHTPLSGLIARHPINAMMALTIVQGICDALIECRDAGILHLDLQPDNLFVDDDMTVRLGDFGCALFVDELRENVGLRGSLAYIAPEVYRDGRCSVKSDVYSMGLLMYSLFNGNSLPFSEVGREELGIYKRLSGTPFPDVDLSATPLRAGIMDLIRDACAFNPEDRLDFGAFRARANSLLSMAYDCDDAFMPLPRGPRHAVIIDDSDLTGPVGAWKPASGSAPKSSPASASKPDAPSNADHRNGLIDRLSKVFNADLFAATMAIFPPASKPKASPASSQESRGVFGAAQGFSDARNIPGNSQANPSSAFDIRGASFESPDVKTDQLPGAPVHTLADPQTSPSVAPGALPPAVSQVQFSAVAPKALVRDEYAMIDIVMYEASWRHVVDELIGMAETPVHETRSGLMRVSENATVKVELSSPDIDIDDGVDTQFWQGGYLRFSFACMLPEDYAKKQVLFTACVYIDDVIMTRLKFIARCDATPNQQLVVTRADVLSAFISYASQDRAYVATVVQGMKKARPDMNIFFDVESLRSGEDWMQTLCREIDARDVLYLCWSHHAKQSKWVNFEWRHAYEHKGSDCIEPIPIESPDQCPPPAELEHKHFNDRLLYIIHSNGGASHSF